MVSMINFAGNKVKLPPVPKITSEGVDSGSSDHDRQVYSREKLEQMHSAAQSLHSIAETLGRMQIKAK